MWKDIHVGGRGNVGGWIVVWASDCAIKFLNILCDTSTCEMINTCVRVSTQGVVAYLLKRYLRIVHTPGSTLCELASSVMWSSET